MMTLTDFIQGKLNLVDLAGSERQSKTEATGDRLKEVKWKISHHKFFLSSSTFLIIVWKRSTFLIINLSGWASTILTIIAIASKNLVKTSTGNKDQLERGQLFWSSLLSHIKTQQNRQQRSTCPSPPWATSSLPSSMDDPPTSRTGSVFILR